MQFTTPRTAGRAGGVHVLTRGRQHPRRGLGGTSTAAGWRSGGPYSGITFCASPSRGLAADRLSRMPRRWLVVPAYRGDSCTLPLTVMLTLALPASTGRLSSADVARMAWARQTPFRPGDVIAEDLRLTQGPAAEAELPGHLVGLQLEARNGLRGGMRRRASRAPRATTRSWCAPRSRSGCGRPAADSAGMSLPSTINSAVPVQPLLPPLGA